MKLLDKDVLYEDNHVLVLNKPHGLLTQPTEHEEDSLETRAKAYLKEKYQKPGNVFLHAIHRLDKPVSGVVLFAKTSKALSRLNATMRSKQHHKVYHAQIEGKLPKNEGTLIHTLSHGEHEAYSDPHGKLSRLHYKVLPDATVEVILDTGRYHQIRAQLALSGCPIKGDLKYGAKTILKNSIALKAVKMAFPHPITGELIEISCL